MNAARDHVRDMGLGAMEERRDLSKCEQTEILQRFWRLMGINGIGGHTDYRTKLISGRDSRFSQS